MRKGVQLPHEIKIHERHEVGLDPINEVSMIEAPPEVPSEDHEEVVAAEEVVDAVLQKIAEIETTEDVQGDE